jgi:hypothetical protein
VFKVLQYFEVECNCVRKITEGLIRKYRTQIGDILYEGLSGYKRKCLAIVGNVLGECHAPCMFKT